LLVFLVSGNPGTNENQQKSQIYFDILLMSGHGKSEETSSI